MRVLLRGINDCVDDVSQGRDLGMDSSMTASRRLGSRV